MGIVTDKLCYGSQLFSIMCAAAKEKADIGTHNQEDIAILYAYDEIVRLKHKLSDHVVTDNTGVIAEQDAEILRLATIVMELTDGQ